MVSKNTPNLLCLLAVPRGYHNPIRQRVASRGSAALLSTAIPLSLRAQVLQRLLGWLEQGAQHPLLRGEACVRNKLAHLLAVLLAVRARGAAASGQHPK